MGEVEEEGDEAVVDVEVDEVDNDNCLQQLLSSKCRQHFTGVWTIEFHSVERFMDDLLRGEPT